MAKEKKMQEVKKKKNERKKKASKITAMKLRKKGLRANFSTDFLRSPFSET